MTDIVAVILGVLLAFLWVSWIFRLNHNRCLKIEEESRRLCKERWGVEWEQDQ